MANQTTLPQQYTTRPATMDDLEALTSLYNDYWKTLTGVVKFTLEDFRTIFSTPGFEIASSMQVVLSPDGDIIASGLVIDLNQPPVHPNVYGCVQADYEGKGIGSYLLDWSEERARQAIERVPDGARVSMYVQTAPTHQPSINLLEKHGLQPVRYSWIMQIELDEVPPVPRWPEDLQIKTYEQFSDIEAILAAIDEAFEDHWGHVDRSEDTARLERFRHSIETDETFDPTIWYIAMDEDEIAGVALCSPRLGEDHQMGWVDVLGVRRPWRKQGLGLALLHQAFSKFYQRDYERVGLGVDTQNLTGATRLYEKAGMHVQRQIVIYEKELKPGEELAKQS